jgi:hypothetical protein
VACLLAAVLLWTACGAGAAGPPRTRVPPGAAVTIEIRPGPGVPPRRYTLRCDPADGTLPDPGEACARIASTPGVAALLAPPPVDEVCTQIYGGPGRALVRGTLRGRPVDLAFTRRNGCEIDRYDRILELFGLS